MRKWRTSVLGIATLAFGIACSSSSNDTGASAGGAAGGGSGGGGNADAAGDTWANYAQGFFTKYCTECHGADNTTRNYSTIADVIRDKGIIRCGVAPTTLDGCGSFPPPKQFPIDNATRTNPKPSDDERSRIVAWLEAGLPQ